MEQSPTVALVLGAGSAKGLAHIGVMQVLVENNIPFNLIVGTSMGAMIGGFYACGTDLFMLGKMVENMDTRVFFDVHMPRFGFIAGRKMDQFLALLTKGKSFETIDVPTIMVATDLLSGQRVLLETGPVADAIRASISVPGVFNPVKKEEMILVDGAVTDRLPIEVARERQADVVIAVDVMFGQGREVNIKNTLDVILTALDIMQKQQFDMVSERADILIQPRVAGYSPRDFEKARDIIALGRSAAEEKLEEIKAKIRNHMQ